MGELTDSDWPAYLCSLRDDEARALAVWLATEGLDVGEFMEIVDQAYVAAPDHWRGRSRPFMVGFGRPAAQAYARRKRRLAGLMVAFEDALVSGALPGDVTPQDLQPATSACLKQRQAEEVLSALERARRGQE